MKTYLIFNIIILLVFLIGCNPKLTDSEETKPEIYIGYAVSDSGQIFKSSNGGVNWVSINSGITTRLNSVYTFSPAVAIAVGDNGVIIKTTDGGNSWFSQTSGTNVSLKKITLNTQTNQYWIVCEQGVLLNTSNYY